MMFCRKSVSDPIIKSMGNYFPFFCKQRMVSLNLSSKYCFILIVQTDLFKKTNVPNVLIELSENDKFGRFGNRGEKFVL